MPDFPAPTGMNEVDVVIIGSGFGGSITANRLAQAGKRVLVLERGPWRDSLPVRSMGVQRRAPFPYGWKAFSHFLRSVQFARRGLNLNKSGMFEFFSYPGVSVLAASGVGGGSMAYGGLLAPPRDPQYWRGRHPQLDPSQVEAYYSKILDDMGAVPFTPAHCVPQSVWTQFEGSGARRCRPAEVQPHMAMLLPPSSQEAGRPAPPVAGIERLYCGFDGDSFLGSRGGAKASVDFVYLAPVLDKGATVRDLCEVSEIQRGGAPDGGGYTVHFKDLATGKKQTARAAQVIVAAGTMNTLLLLFSSCGKAGGLAPMPALGRTFGANGDLMGALGPGGEDTSSFRSTPSLGAFTVEGHGGPDFGLGGFPGVDTLPLPGLLKRKLKQFLFMYGIGVDSGRASVGFRNGRLHVEYDQRQEPVYEDIRAAFGVLKAETGRAVWLLGKPLTVHQWGGACVGPNAEQGVVDHRGEVYGNPGLYVADGAALPAAPGGPPSLAISAWAHHVANGIANAGKLATS